MGSTPVIDPKTLTEGIKTVQDFDAKAKTPVAKANVARMSPEQKTQWAHFEKGPGNNPGMRGGPDTKTDADTSMINQHSAGTTYPPGKKDDENDALGNPAEYERNAKPVTDAKDEPGATLRAVHTQAGKNWDNRTAPNSGCDCDADD